ncbi:exonuclease domain-containing protein [Micromonospora sp. DT233]|uniref:3'-5' exonuclease n=1 Tax=Micromonospora sp. DT233 TaxID=3393432 RepID=UPI003CEEF2F6
MSGSPSAPWTAASLVVIDLEGSGAQDRENEAILEIALVPLRAGLPHMPTHYTTLVNPGRPIGRRSWLSPGLTDAALRHAPTLGDVAGDLADRINGRYLVGHNVNVDWRLLHRRLPDIHPAGLIDTLRLARALPGNRPHGLAALIDGLHLTERVNTAAPGSQPHRAIWDTVAAAVLLPELISRRWAAAPPTISELAAVAGVPMPSAKQTLPPAPHPALF